MPSPPATQTSKPCCYKIGTALSTLYIAIRLATVTLSPITDCDEVFNYWEPLHFILYGSGMQTWEYAPQYALRTYAYLLPMAGIAKCLQFLLKLLPTSLQRQLFNLLLLQSPPFTQLQTTAAATTATMTAITPSNNKPLLFHLLRTTLLLTSLHSELTLLTSIHDILSSTLAHWTALCSFFATGHFHSTGAYLPSSTVMMLWRWSAAYQLRGWDGLAIFWGLLAVLGVGWPFCAVLFVTTGVWSLWSAGSNGGEKSGMCIKSMAKVLLQTATQTLLIQTLVMTIDYHFYGRVVSPIWNIFVYNATAGGDELYGVEPLSYYVKNLLLNFNFVAVGGCAALPVWLGRKGLEWFFSRRVDLGGVSSRDGLKVLILLPMYIWMGIVFPRPHKEERFLFPIYPMLCFGAAITLEELITVSMLLLSFFRPKFKAPSLKKIRLLGVALLSPFAIISISRSIALHHNYSAPLDLYQHFFYHHITSGDITPTTSPNKVTYICTAGEWYRFPSSFFLPPNTQLGFLKSSFSGQLPQPFTEFGSREESLAVQDGAFNDVNREEMDRYVSIEQCSYVVEMVPSQGVDEGGETPECIDYMESDSREWTQIASYKYLDATSTSALHRILYIPFGRSQVKYNGYNLYSASEG